MTHVDGRLVAPKNFVVSSMCIVLRIEHSTAIINGTNDPTVRSTPIAAAEGLFELCEVELLLY
jgi:hypothetical protein